MTDKYPTKGTLLEQAESFYKLYFSELKRSGLDQRMEQIRREIEQRGTYWQEPAELAYGARVAWRNSNRCVGRLFWKTLKVRDLRHIDTPKGVFDAMVEHLHLANNGGNIRSYISIFRPQEPDGTEPIRILNSKLIHYAGYEREGAFVGDPSELERTKTCQALGWKGKGTDYDVLPLLVQKVGSPTAYFEWPPEAVLEVGISHPEYPWFADLGVRWYAVPVISDMILEVGGIRYPCAPFNGWYMLSEIACRNLTDEHRYNLLPKVAKKMGLDTSKASALWKDRALLEVNEAVLHSFRQQGVTISDHHTAAEQFMHFCKSESVAQREVQAEWSWIVPPMSSACTPVYHQHWQNEVLSPNYYYR